MKKKPLKKSIIACSACVAVCLLSIPMHTNLVSGCGFELPGNAPFQTISGSLGAWSIDAGSVDLINGYWGAVEGAKSIDLSGNAPATISQSVTTGVGQNTLRFALWGTYDGIPATKTVPISLGSFSQTVTITPTDNKSSPYWIYKTWAGTLGAGSNKLEFKELSRAPGTYGATLDSLSAPETTMIAGALLLLPFGASTIRFFCKPRVA